MLNTMKLTPRGEREIVITRDFNASREMVWDAMTKPELIRKWLFGPPGWVMSECVEDHRVGGKFRWAWRGPDGVEMAMHGEYREVTPPERMVRTETFAGCPAGAGQQICTLTLADQGGKTAMSLVVEYPSNEARDMALQTGMEQGMSAGYDRLEGLLPSLV